MTIDVWKRKFSSDTQTREECFVNVTIFGFRFEEIIKWTVYTTHFPDDNQSV